MRRVYHRTHTLLISDIDRSNTNAVEFHKARQVWKTSGRPIVTEAIGECAQNKDLADQWFTKDLAHQLQMLEHTLMDDNERTRTRSWLQQRDMDES